MKRSVRVLVACVVSLSSVGVPARQAVQDTNDAVVLITLDGARTEEIFGGLDADIFRSTLRNGQVLEQQPMYRRYWAATPDERRRTLMPFFWRLVTEHGSIAGNPALGSSVRLGNAHRFSYPGYSEILVGEPHDAEIKSNDPIRNPFSTVLEAFRSKGSLPRDKVATFAGWSVFNEIVEHTEGATFVNAGVEALEGSRHDIRLLNELQREAATPWDGTRFDAFTFRMAMAHLEAARPRVLYVAFDETDDWAHDGRYDRLLESYARTDAYLEQLWTWLQSQPDYRGRTHVLITTDHGRGHTATDWRDHGVTIEGAQDVWIAFASPTMTRRGEWRGGPPLSTSQVAATLASWRGIDWTADHPRAGRPIIAR
jgi:hypothetical protein